jgi:NitT/TauT family transport system substrate-binding protein
LIVRIILIFFILSHALTFPVRGEQLKKVVFVPQWLPQAQFAGYYAAKEKGIYKKYGIDITILRGGPDYIPSAMLTQGKTDFTTMFLSTAIQKRTMGIRLVNIAQITQRSGFILVAKKTSGILTPKDLDGKKVGLWSDFQLQPLAFFRKYGVKMRTVPQGATVNLFLRGGVDVASAMWYNEYHVILNAGIDEDELTTFFFDQHTLNFPEDGIYCLEETLKKDRQLCRNFVKASIEGWQYAFEHPEEALDIVMKYISEANIGTNRVHQKWMLNRMGGLILPAGKDTSIGTLKEEDYNTVVRELLLGGIIKNIPPFGEFYVNCAKEK